MAGEGERQGDGHYAPRTCTTSACAAVHLRLHCLCSSPPPIQRAQPVDARRRPGDLVRVQHALALPPGHPVEGFALVVQAPHARQQQGRPPQQAVVAQARPARMGERQAAESSAARAGGQSLAAPAAVDLGGLC